MSERLTKNNYTDDIFKVKETQYEYNNALWEYVKEHEDIEENYGVDLTTLFKLIEQNKVYYKFFNEIQEWSPIKVDLRKKVVWFAWQPHQNKYASRLPLSEIGKSLVLTKEELL